VERPEPPRPARRGGGPRKALVGLTLLALTAGGVLFVAKSRGWGKSISIFGGREADVLKHKVRRGTIAVKVKDTGALESANNKDVYCDVEGNTTIIFIMPEGKGVQKDEVVCRLDHAALDDNLTNQRIVTERAAADLKNAEETLAVAKMTLNEYTDGTFVLNKQTYQGAIKQASSDWIKASERVKWAQRMFKKGYNSELQLMTDTIDLQKAEISLANAKAQLDQLEKYTKPTQVKTLGANITKAESDVLAKRATFGLEKGKQEKLEKQIAKCTLKAPADGIVVYANDPGRFGQQQLQIEEGATVRQSQKIFSLPDIAQMQVNAKIHESRVNWVKPGMRAQIRVDAMADTMLTGTVKEVKPLPDANNWMSSDVKKYTTLVSIDSAPPNIRPGMNAQVEIMVTEVPDVLSVPIQSVIELGGKKYVYVVRPGVRAERREVTIGLSNEKMIELKDGLKESEDVALNPQAVMSDEDRREYANATLAAGKGSNWVAGKGKMMSAEAAAKAAKGAGVPGAGKGAGRGGPGGPGGGMGGPGGGGPGGPGGGMGGPGGGARGGRGAFAALRDPKFVEKIKDADPEEAHKLLTEKGIPEMMQDRIIERVKSGQPLGPPPGGGGGMGGPGGGMGGPGGPGGGFGGGPGGPQGGPGA
jgi:RND family efflux transporter MFP subunit